jgi:hypothetical protein
LEYILHVFDEILPILCQKKGNNEKALCESMEPVMDPMIEMIMEKITGKNKNTPLALAFSMGVYEDIAHILDVENNCSTDQRTKSFFDSESEQSSIRGTLEEATASSIYMYNKMVNQEKKNLLHIAMWKGIIGNLRECKKIVSRSEQQESTKVRLFS